MLNWKGKKVLTISVLRYPTMETVVHNTLVLQLKNQMYKNLNRTIDGSFFVCYHYVLERKKEVQMQRILEEMDEYLFRMYDGLLKELMQTESYRNDSDEAGRLEDKYPIIRQILEGEVIQKELVLTVEAQTAMKEFVKLRINMLDDLQIKYYLRGFHDCISLLIKSGMLN